MPRRRYLYVLPLLALSLLLILMSLPGFSGRFLKSLKASASPATTFTVNSTGDGPDINPADGVCNDGTGACTLRAAIQEANAASGADTINFSLAANSTITLNTQLGFNGNISIVGPGASLLTIQRSSAAGTPIFPIFSFIPINGNFNDSISGVTISNGDATGTFSSNMSGGGILNFSFCALTLTDVVITGNTSTNGGGLYNDGTATLTNCKITSNSSPNGGGILNGGALTIINSTISGNAAPNGAGGGVVNRGGTVSITGSTVSGNTCDAQGGGIVNKDGVNGAGSVTLTNSTVSGNSATGVLSNGIGGISNNAGANTLTLINTTVTANTASGSGSGVAGIFNGSGSTANLKNSIVAQNMSALMPHDLNGTFNSQGYNLIGKSDGTDGFTDGVNGDQVGTYATPVDPKLGVLTDNSGPTKTHALLVGSPAIDAGNSALLNDQRGQPRPVDNQTVVNAAGGNASDIGAYEAHTFEVNSTADTDDGLCRALGTGNGCTLREAINAANGEAGAELIVFAPALTSGGPATITLSTVLPNLSSDMTISGPGASLLTVERSVAGGTPRFRIFTNAGPVTANISGLTISNGHTADGTAGGNGDNGGAILNVFGSTLNLTNVVISGNVTGDGDASGGLGGYGGAIFNNGNVTLIASSVSDNRTGNGPTAVGGRGGGIFNSGTLTIRDSSISNNLTGTGLGGSGGGSGGGISSDLTLTITGSTISGNSTGAGVDAGGGGIWAANTLTIANSTISGNQANAYGGGLATFFGGTTLTNVTINNNRGGNLGGGGLYRDSGTVTLRNTVVAGNYRGASPSTTADDIFGAMDPVSSFNLIGTGGSGGLTNGTNNNQIGVSDPKLASLSNNGGPTQTNALLPGSPAIDAGSNANLPSDTFDLDGDGNTSEPVPFDQRGSGFSRASDGNGDGASTVDIGAYEVQSIIVTNTADSGAGSLRQAITDANVNPGSVVINFQAGLTGTITLLSALPDLSTSMDINGPGATQLTIQRSTAGGTPVFRIFRINSGQLVNISGLTLSNGSAPAGAFPGNSGGAILNSGSLVLDNTVISANTANSGGGISSQGPLTLRSTTVSGNNATFAGGGISTQLQGVSPTITITDSTLSGNSVTGSGGGLFNSNLAGTTTLTVSNSTISGNMGGGVYNSVSQGGMIIGTISNVTISGNTSGFGGGIANSSQTSGSTVNLAISNSTISGNNAAGTNGIGGGIANNEFGSTNTLTLHNTIVAGNFRNSGASSSDISSSVDPASSFNLIGDGTGMTGVSNGSNGNIVGTSGVPILPLLGPLANNGGPTQTHALLAGSPALDAGNNSRVTNPPFSGPPFTDQRGAGFARIVDGPDADTTDTVDIGAFEAQVSIANIADQTINEDGSLSLLFNVGGAASITSVTATSSNTTLVPNNPVNISITGSGSSRTLQINPVANASGTSTITVTVNGNNSQTMTDTFLLTVNSVNDAPTDIALSSNSVADNSPTGTMVGTFSSSDPEVGDTFTYSLVFGAGSVDNSSFTISGNQLITNSIFDFETKSSYSIRVRSTDQSTGFFEKQFAITVSDAADSPGAISFSSANYNVGEGNGSAGVILTRSGGTHNKVVAKVSLTDVTTSPADYVFKPGTFDASFNAGSGATSGSSAIPQFVKSVLLQPDGKTIIGGAFLFYNGVPRSRIARINPSGALDTSFDPGTGANNHILTMALQPDGKIIIGGLFNIYNGTARFRIARLNSDGTLDSTFGGVPDDAVRAIVVQPDGKIIIGGDFFIYNGISCNRIARLNSDGSFDFSFNTGLGSNAGVTALALQPDGKVLVGGGFTNFGSAANTRLVRLNINGSLDGSFNSATLLSLVPRHLVLQSNGKLLIGGEFINNDSPLGRRGIARLNDNGSEDVSFNPGTGTDGNTVEAVVLQPDGKIIIVGQFTTFNTTPINRIARLSTTGALDGSFNPAPGADFPVLAAALQPDGKIIIGGQYTFYDNVSSNGITRVNGDLFVTWVPGDAGNKSITLPIVDDALDEPNETLTFTVTPLSGGATTGANPNATLTIADNDPSATTLSSVSGGGAFGGTASLTATLMSLGSPLNGKTVNFSLNGTAVGNAVTNINGVATLPGVSLAGINAGFYPTAVGASFTGDANNYSSANNTGPLNVGKASTATGLTSSVNPSAFGQSVTFTATVTSGGGVPGGTVQFKSDGSNIGSTVALNASGIASLTTSALTSGTHTITGNYSGNTNFLASTGTLAAAQVVIPSLAINDVSTTEGDSGVVSATFTITLSAPSNQTVTVNFATADGSAHTIPAPPGITPPGSDYFSNIGSVTFAPMETSKPVSVAVIGDFTFEANETFLVNLSAPTNATISDPQGTGTINNDDAQGGKIGFSSPAFNVAEIAGSILISVNRKGDTTQAVTVDYETTDLTADGRKDYTPSSGTLHFDVGQAGRDIQVLINMDSFPEASELVQLTLSNPTGGAALGVPATTTLQIDNTPWSAPPANPIDDADRFVRQHYHDFLNREAANDPDGLAFWTNQITECQQPGATCNAELRRINVSAAFFLSIEFQETGYLVERLYKSAYGDATGASNFGPPHQLPVPVIRFNEFLPDTQRIGEGVVVGRSGWEQVLESNKVAFILDFVSRLRFTTAYPTTMTPVEFVDTLYLHAGVTPSAAERTSVIGEFGGAGTSADTGARARVLRRVAENSTLVQQEKNRAFVLIQYFGYLRRDPNDLPDSDYSGYDFWLTKLNEFNGNFVNAEMVKAFIVSGEYRQRFGP